MRILFFGSGAFAVPTFDSIRADGHEIVAVVTQPDKVRGRGSKTTPTPVKAAALDAGVAVVDSPNVNAPDIVSHLKSLEAELAYVAAYGQKIGQPLLEAFPAGIVNLHGSLLPALRGAAPIQWSILNGTAEAGVTVFRLVEKMDAGPILVQRRTAVGKDETADELHDRLARIGCDAVRATIELLEANPAHPGTPQDAGRVTFAPKLKKTDGRIDFDRPVDELACRIRGLWSWPGAVCRFQSDDGRRDEVVTLARAIPYEGKNAPAASPDALGRISEVMGVQARDSELALLEIKPAGGRLMTWQDFVNGRHVKPGDRFLPLEAG